MAITPRPMMGLPNSPSFRYKALNPAYQSDPRRILGQQLMQQGSSSAPVQTPLQGLGRLSSALVGAYLQKGAVDRQVAREGEYKDKLTNALSGMNLPANSPINALAEVDPLTAINAAVLRNTNLELARQKAPATFSTPTRDEISAAGGNPDASGFFQKNNKTNKLEFTRIDNIPKSGFPSLVNELIRIDKILPENRTRADDLMYKFYSAQLSRDREVPIMDEKTGNTVLRKIPGINVKSILSGEVTNNEEKVSEDKKNENVVKFAKLNQTESKFVGQLKSAQGELDQLLKIFFKDGDLENGEINTSVIASLNIPGASLFSEEAQIANNILMNLSDLRLRDKTGATANPGEVKLYYGLVQPNITDKAGLVRQKIRRLVNELNNNIQIFSQGRKIKDLKELSINTKENTSEEEVEF
jgi:hypothetical protein